MRSEQHLHYGPSAEGDGSLDRVLPSPLQRRTHSLSWPNPWTSSDATSASTGNLRLDPLKFDQNQVSSVPVLTRRFDRGFVRRGTACPSGRRVSPLR
jgi:hypothetical protein